MDAWSYLNRPCQDVWLEGAKYELNNCYAAELACPEFISSTELYGTYDNNTWSLSAGGKCDVKIDSTNGIARVIFAETSYLGIEAIEG